MTRYHVLYALFPQSLPVIQQNPATTQFISILCETALQEIMSNSPRLAADTLYCLRGKRATEAMEYIQRVGSVVCFLLIRPSRSTHQ